MADMRTRCYNGGSKPPACDALGAFIRSVGRFHLYIGRACILFRIISAPKVASF